MISMYLSLISDAASRSKLRELYEAYRQPMYRAAYQILHEPYLAEDAVHNAFLRIASHMENVGEVDAPRTRGYVLIIARNAAIDLYHQNRRQVPSEEVDEMLIDLQDVVLETESRDVQRQIYEMIRSLEPAYCDILLLKFYYDMDDAKIAETLGLTLTNTRVRIHRAREKLKAKIKAAARSGKGGLL